MIEGSWTSTIVRASLAKTTNTPIFGFVNEFQLPVDPATLKVLQIDELPIGSIEYTIEGDKLLTDEGTINIRYIARIVDTEDWDNYLQRAFISRLTSELALPLTGDVKKSQAEFQRYELFVQQGLAQNGQQGSSELVTINGLIEVR